MPQWVKTVTSQAHTVCLTLNKKATISFSQYLTRSSNSRLILSLFIPKTDLHVHMYIRWLSVLVLLFPSSQRGPQECPVAGGRNEENEVKVLILCITWSRDKRSQELDQG